MLLYGRNQHRLVKQLSSNYKINLGKEKAEEDKSIFCSCSFPSFWGRICSFFSLGIFLLVSLQLKRTTLASWGRRGWHEKIWLEFSWILFVNVIPRVRRRAEWRKKFVPEPWRVKDFLPYRMRLSGVWGWRRKEGVFGILEIVGEEWDAGSRGTKYVYTYSCLTLYVGI